MRGLTIILAGLVTFTQAAAIERDIVISAYQGPCVDGDFHANLAKAQAIVPQALESGSQFILFPECFLSGYRSLELVQRGARSLDDPDLQAFIDNSKAHDAVILIGLARLTDDGIYNSILVVQSGKLLGIYDKVMLTGGDRDVLQFKPGTTVPVFDAHGVRFAVVVCHDTSFLQPALAARLKGAEVLFAPHFNYIQQDVVDAHRRWVRNCHVGLACHLRVGFVRSNVVVTDQPGHVGYGGSCILSPQGSPLADADLFRTQLITATLSPKMFQPPVTWGDLSEVPAWLNQEVAEQLTKPAHPDSVP